MIGLQNINYENREFIGDLKVYISVWYNKKLKTTGIIFPAGNKWLLKFLTGWVYYPFYFKNCEVNFISTPYLSCYFNCMTRHRLEFYSEKFILTTLCMNGALNTIYYLTLFL
jgi:hypothetical protein